MFAKRAAVWLCVLMLLMQYSGLLRGVHLTMGHEHGVKAIVTHVTAGELGTCGIEGAEEKNTEHRCGVCEQLTLLRQQMFEDSAVGVHDVLGLVETLVAEGENWTMEVDGELRGRGPPMG
ncbi:hypothetical protein [Poriferisphaera corsica]|nr:hypothetical protein [Poriferisphaera corsica]